MGAGVSIADKGQRVVLLSASCLQAADIQSVSTITMSVNKIENTHLVTLAAASAVAFLLASGVKSSGNQVSLSLGSLSVTECFAFSLHSQLCPYLNPVSLRNNSLLVVVQS